MQGDRESNAVAGILSQHTLLAGLMLRTPFAFGAGLEAFARLLSKYPSVSRDSVESVISCGDCYKQLLFSPKQSPSVPGSVVMLSHSCDVVKYVDTVTEVGVFTCFFTSIGVPAIVKFIVTPELFCTKHRALAVGSATVWTRIGGECVVGHKHYRKGHRPIWTHCGQLCGARCPATALAIINTNQQPRNMRTTHRPHS